MLLDEQKIHRASATHGESTEREAEGCRATWGFTPNCFFALFIYVIQPSSMISVQPERDLIWRSILMPEICSH